MIEKFKIPEHVFCLLVGGVYLYAVLRAILGATFIQTYGTELYLIGFFAILFMMIVLFNYITRIVFALLLLTSGFLGLATWEIFYEQQEHFYEVFLMVTGQIPYRPHLGPTVVWILAILLAFALVVFMVHCFNFYVLAIGGVAAFLFTWIPGFSRDEGAFLLFFVAFCLLLLKNANKSVSAVFAAAPICVAVILFAQSVVPAESSLYERRHIGDTRRVNDFFYELFNPAHFSFQTTGFSGPGGRLGGPVTPNDRYVMTVVAPGRTYLAGAISNEYTGTRWLRSLGADDIYTHGIEPSWFEMLETTAALIRGATHSDSRDIIHAVHLGVSYAEVRHINMRHFPVLGVIELLNFQRVPGGAGAYIFTPVPTAEFRNLYTEMGFQIDSPRSYINQVMIETNLGEVFFFPTTYYMHTYIPLDFAEIRPSPGHRTGTVFRPPRAMYMRFGEDSTDYIDVIETLPTGDMQTPGFMSRGTAYHIRFLNVDANRSFVEQILRNTGAGVYENLAEQRFPTFAGRDGIFGSDRASWNEAQWLRQQQAQFVPLYESQASVDEIISLFEIFTPREARSYPQYIDDSAQLIRLLDSFSREILAPYAQQVRQHFLDVPEITPHRVHELTHEIIRDAQTDFERVMAIRAHLLQLPYTLDPEPVPRGVCFVDWFLFEGQEGYCTYFASAMAVMSRIAGVPSRYVEGFVLPPTDDPETPVRVTNRMAHAWVEVYLEGFGWHIMEATPTYAFLLNPTAPYAPDFVPGAGFTNPYWVERMQDLMPDFMPPDFEDFATPPPFTAPIRFDDYDEENFITPQRIARWIFAATVLAVIIFFSIYALRIKHILRRAKKLPPGEQVKVYFRAVQSVVAYFTSHPLPEETEKLYGLRTGKRFAYRSDTVFFRDLIALYYKAKFSHHEISAEEADLMREAYIDMLRLLRMTRLKYVYLYLRHVRGVGKMTFPRKQKAKNL